MLKLGYCLIGWGLSTGFLAVLLTVPPIKAIPGFVFALFGMASGFFFNPILKELVEEHKRIKEEG